MNHSTKRALIISLIIFLLAQLFNALYWAEKDAKKPTATVSTVSDLSGFEVSKDFSHREPVSAEMILREVAATTNQHSFVVDKDKFLTVMVPLLGLNERDKVLSAWFGENSDGRFLMVAIQKYSSSRRMYGVFDVIFHLSGYEGSDEDLKHERFKVTEHGIIGHYRTNELIGIYDKSLLNYLILDQNNDMKIAESWPVHFELGSNVIGFALAHYLDKIEQSSDTTYQNYQKQAYQIYKIDLDVQKSPRLHGVHVYEF